jgi:hypothetical protein
MRGVKLLVVLLLALLAACGGGGGGGGSTPTSPPPPPPPPPTTQPSVTFTPSAAAGAGSIALAMGADSTTTKLVLEVRSGSIQDLYGVAFDLQYPANLLQLTAATPGDLLPGASFQQSSTATGNVVIGVSRLGIVPGVSSAGVVARLEFKPLVTGTGVLSFSRNAALDSKAVPISGVTWIAGSFTSVVP